MKLLFLKLIEVADKSPSAFKGIWHIELIFNGAEI